MEEMTRKGKGLLGNKNKLALPRKWLKTISWLYNQDIHMRMPKSAMHTISFITSTILGFYSTTMQFIQQYLC